MDGSLTVDGVHKSLLFQNDALSNIIGFKGAGFFTVSFPFVGSVCKIAIVQIGNIACLLIKVVN